MLPPLLVLEEVDPEISAQGGVCDSFITRVIYGTTMDWSVIRTLGIYFEVYK